MSLIDKHYKPEEVRTLPERRNVLFLCFCGNASSEDLGAFRRHLEKSGRESEFACSSNFIGGLDDISLPGTILSANHVATPWRHLLDELKEITSRFDGQVSIHHYDRGDVEWQDELLRKFDFSAGLRKITLHGGFKSEPQS